MKKRLLSLLLCLVMVFTLFPEFAVPAKAAAGDQYEYVVVDDKTSWEAGDAIPEGDNIYALVNGEYVQVNLTSGGIYSAITQNGSVKNSWTAAEARSTYLANTSRIDQNIYYMNGSTPEIVYVDTEPYYRNTGTINANVFASALSFSYITNNDRLQDVYYYYNSAGDINTNEPFWHRVHENTRGVTLDGYYAYLWYYRDAEDSFANGEILPWNTGDASNFTSAYRTALSNGTVVRLPNSPYTSGNYAPYDAYYTFNPFGSNKNYTGGKLYTRINQSRVYNSMFTRPTQSTKNYLAWPLTQESSSSSTIPGSSTYSGPLYYHEHDGLTKITLAADGTLLPGSTELHTTGTVYPDKLYYKIDTTIPVTDPDPADDDLNHGVSKEGFKLQKSLEDNGDGSYDIQMKSYSTAKTIQEGFVEKVPTDFVVIVDQSGSMKEKDMATGYNPVSGTKTLEQVAEGNYYVQDSDGRYYRVYGTRDYLMEYHAPNSLWTKNVIDDGGMSLSWFQGTEEATFGTENQYYYKSADGVYRPVHVTATGKVGTYYIKFYYYNAAGEKIEFTRPGKPTYKSITGGTYSPNSFGYGALNTAVLTAYPDTHAYTYSEFIGITTGMYINYPMYSRHLGYTKLCYRDVDGVEHIVSPTSGYNVAEYCNSDGQAVTSAGGSTRMNYNKLFTATGTQTRLEALQNALTAFVQAVADESDSKEGSDSVCAVDNRIAIVGFSSDTDTSNNYNNTELLTGSTFSITTGSAIPSNAGTSIDGYNHNGKQMSAATTADYAGALIKVNNNSEVGTVNSKLTDAINAVTAYGGTQPEYGFQMAKSILDNRADTQYTLQTGDKSTKDRNKIVIFFTDGHPGDYEISNQYTEANDVVASALPLKDDGAKVFTIGVFGESDGNPLTYADESLTTTNVNNTRDWKFKGGWVETYVEEGTYYDTYYCLRRQWRPAGASTADNYTASPNDTIFDYMSVVSSNYPDAENYIAPKWLTGNYNGDNGYTGATDGVRHKDTASATNQFYRMAANQATLVEAFKQSVSYASSQQQSTNVVTLDTTSVFRDVVNTADFDISNATYSVTWVPIYVDKNLVTDGHPSAIGDLENDPEFPVVNAVVNEPVPESGVIEYRGFDYGANHVSWAKTKGYRLEVTVHGIVPLRYNEDLFSNVDTADIYGCGIYEYGKDTPSYQVQSPKLNVPLVEPTGRGADLKKSLSGPAGDGSYTVKLQAYAKANSSGEAVPLDKDTYLQDVIDLDNLTLRSDLSEPIIKAYTLKGTADKNQNVTFEDDSNMVDITENVEITYDDATGTVTVKGFDYNANYIGYPKPMNTQEGTAMNQGKKIIVTIGGLVPYHAGTGLTSNDDDALDGVKGCRVYDKNDELVKDVVSPTFSVGSEGNAKTYLIDFNAPMTVATDATSMAQLDREDDSEPNGTFILSEGKIIYEFNKSVVNRNLILGGVDKAFGRGKLVGTDMTEADWVTITAIPASSVYFDDDFAKLTKALTVGDGSGYNVGVTASPAKNETTKGTYTFTFKGTGIDVYCTTDPDGRYVQAKLQQNGAAVPGQANQTVKNFDKTVTRYNVPSISFTGLTYGEYTLTLNVLGSSHYKLDGIRVYGPIGDQDVYEDTTEQYAAYISMREALVNNNMSARVSDTLTDTTSNAIAGALFVDDSTKLSQYVTATEQEIADGNIKLYFKNSEGKYVEVKEDVTVPDDAVLYKSAYASDFEAYQKNSPKNEIYLDNGQAVTFQLTPAGANAAASGNLWIGLSAPDDGKNTGTVTIGSVEKQVTSGVDMYYPITSDMIGTDRSVTLTNTGSSMISVTNLKITGNADIYNAAYAKTAQTRSADDAMASTLSVEDAVSMVFEPVTMRTVKLAANNGVDPDAAVEPETPATPEPTPTPAPTPAPTSTPGIHSFVQQFLSSFMQSLFKSISRLFGN